MTSTPSPIGQYTSKILWVDQRAPDDEGTIELFPDDTSMQARLKYLQAVTGSSPLFTQYIFPDAKSKSILRLPHALTPQQVQGYQRWLSTIH